MSDDRIDIKRLIKEDPDYVNLPAVRYSLEKLLKKYPDGCPDNIICSALGLHHSDLSVILRDLLEKIKKGLE